LFLFLLISISRFLKFFLIVRFIVFWLTVLILWSFCYTTLGSFCSAMLEYNLFCRIFTPSVEIWKMCTELKTVNWNTLLSFRIYLFLSISGICFFYFVYIFLYVHRFLVCVLSFAISIVSIINFVILCIFLFCLFRLSFQTRYAKNKKEMHEVTNSN